MTSPKEQLAARGLVPKRSFGQNFLADEHLAARLAELGVPELGGGVIEIGAGMGALTSPLLARAGRVVAIERDRDMVIALREIYADEIAAGKLELREADAKTFDYAGELASLPMPRTLVGNLPYQITGPLLERVCSLAGQVSRASFVVQLEVADRLCAAPNTSAYGALSVFAQAPFVPKRELILRRGAFYPQPGVDSAAVRLEPRAEPLAPETPTFRALVHGAFEQRRKQLRNAWSRVGSHSSESVARAAERVGIDLTRRGETLSVQEFAAMTRELDAG